MKALVVRTTFSGLLAFALAAQIPQTGSAGQTGSSTQPGSSRTDQPQTATPDASQDRPSNAATSSRNTADESMLSPTDRQFMTEAAMGGMMEVQLAQLAQKQAQSEDVKQLAQHIEKEHTAANQELKMIAEQRGVELPTSLDAKHQAKIDKFSRLSGAGFDKAYAKEMVKDHKKDVAKFERASRSVMDSSLRTFAEKTLPNLREHMQMAQTSQNSAGTRARTADSNPSQTADPSKDNQSGDKKQ